MKISKLYSLSQEELLKIYYSSKDEGEKRAIKIMLEEIPEEILNRVRDLEGDDFQIRLFNLYFISKRFHRKDK